MANRHPANIALALLVAAAAGRGELARADDAGCAVARAAAPRLVAEIVPRAAPGPAAPSAGRERSPADAFEAAAGASFLKGETAQAASASLQALLLEWTPRHTANAGVARMYLGKHEEAASFVACARSLDPNLVFAIEAQALLAHRRKDCASAKRLIDEVVMRMPRDANARYSAGIIHFKCGDRAGAERELRAAVDLAGVDPVMTAALAVVAPGAAPKSATPPEVRRKIDELNRFMDEAVATAERDRDMLVKIAAIGGQGGASDGVNRAVERLKQTIAVGKAQIERLEAASQKQAAQYPQFAAPAWNALLAECVRQYFRVTADLYRAREPDQGTGQTIVVAASFGQQPLAFAERMRNSGKGWVIQDLAKPYEAVVRANTNIPGVGIRCEPIRESYRELVQRVAASKDALADGLPRAAADYSNQWLQYAAQAADYAKRTAMVTRFAKSEAADKDRWTTHVRNMYAADIGNAVLADVKRFLAATQSRAASDVRGVPAWMQGLRIGICDKEPSPPASLADALAALLDALGKAGSYDASFDTPDCTLAIGSVKISCKPLAFEGVKATLSGPVKVSATVTGERMGVDASVGSFSGGSRGGGRMNVASTSTEASAYGIQGELGVSSWIEQGANGQSNAFVQAKGTLGVGIDAEGLGSVGCELFSATAKFNLRAFAEALAAR